MYGTTVVPGNNNPSSPQVDLSTGMTLVNNVNNNDFGVHVNSHSGMTQSV